MSNEAKTHAERELHALTTDTHFMIFTQLWERRVGIRRRITEHQIEVKMLEQRHADLSAEIERQRALVLPENRDLLS